ncbi:MAG TPA: nitronate monooxygenase, partial [Chitinophagaceae bacterium]|nr:nitronate monooxygenase [Chitinophagaceae bacterium]
SHTDFKKYVLDAGEGDTQLTLKQLTPVRMLKNKFFEQVREAELKGADAEELKNLLGRARAKKGMFEGDMNEGELEIGQVSSLINNILPAGDIVREVWTEFQNALINPLKKA